MADNAVTMHLVAHNMLSSVMHQIKLHTSVLVRAEYGCTLALLDASTSGPGSSSVTTMTRYGRSRPVPALSYRAYDVAFEQIKNVGVFPHVFSETLLSWLGFHLSTALLAVGNLACAGNIDLCAQT